MSTTGMSVGGYQNISGGVSDVDSAATAVNRMINQLFGEVGAMESNNNLTAEQRKQQIADHSKNLQGLAQKMMGILNDPNGVDKIALNNVSKQIAAGLEQLVHSARNASALGLDPDGDLLEGVKGLADCLQNLLTIASEVNKNPNDVDAKARLANAALAAQAALAKLRAMGMGKKSDESFQRLLVEMGKAVNAATGNLVNVANNARLNDASKKPQVDAASKQLSGSGEQMVILTSILAPTAQEAECRNKIHEAASSLQKGMQFLNATARSGGMNAEDTTLMAEGIKALNDALANLLSCTDLPDLTAGTDAQDFSSAAQAITDATTSLMASAGKPDQIRSGAATVGNGNHNLTVAGRALAQGLEGVDKDRFLDYLKRVNDAVNALIAAAPRAAANPRDDRVHGILRDAAQRVAEATQALVNDAGKKVALNALYASAKYAAAATTGLVVSCTTAKGKVNNPEAEKALMVSAGNATAAIASLVEALKGVQDPTSEQAINRSNQILMDASEKFAPLGYKLVASSKGTIPRINDPNTKKELAYSADNAGKAIHKLLVSRKAIKATQGGGAVAAAMEEFQAAEAELEAALLLVQQGMMDPSTNTREAALKNLNGCVKSIANSTKLLANNAKESPEELPEAVSQLAGGVAKLVESTKDLCGTIDDTVLQKQLLGCTKELMGEIRSLINHAQMVSNSPQDENLNLLLSEAGKHVANALFRLVSTSKNVIPKEVENFQKKSGEDMEDLAEKELLGAANVINNAVAKMLAAQEEIRARRQNPEIDIDELNITEAILEACHAIGQTTAVLIQSATAVQKEFNQLRKAPDTQSVYRRDATWAEGLISAAKAVAASVQYLVGVADGAVKGEVRQEALVVAANEVSASTARLVTASTVKNVNSTTQSRLTEASKKVSAATRALVEAAKAAADFQKEQEDQANQEKYALKPEKVREMEEQMEILRLEKELENRRMALLQKRKQEYAESVNETKAAASPQSQTLRPRGGAPPRGGGGPVRGAPSPQSQTLRPSANGRPSGPPGEGVVGGGVPRGRGGFSPPSVRGASGPPARGGGVPVGGGVPRGRGGPVRGGAPRGGGTLRSEESATGRVKWRSSQAFGSAPDFSGMK